MILVTIETIDAESGGAYYNGVAVQQFYTKDEAIEFAQDMSRRYPPSSGVIQLGNLTRVYINGTLYMRFYEGNSY